MAVSLLFRVTLITKDGVQPTTSTSSSSSSTKSSTSSATSTSIPILFSKTPQTISNPKRPDSTSVMAHRNDHHVQTGSRQCHPWTGSAPSISRSSTRPTHNNTGNTTPPSPPVSTHEDETLPQVGERHRVSFANWTCCAGAAPAKNRSNNVKHTWSKACGHSVKRTHSGSGNDSPISPSTSRLVKNGRGIGQCTCTCHRRQNQRRSTRPQKWARTHLDTIYLSPPSSPESGQRGRVIACREEVLSHSSPGVRVEDRHGVDLGQIPRFQRGSTGSTVPSLEDSENTRGRRHTR
ncbi:hypothetical protein DL95DRAFT_96781 [Leptodontidium sp. 2 PMI_412]|nr:hypothetical protein DL95DRAFT_96781 [Leptodontidium sp. 2 PMI_412]